MHPVSIPVKDTTPIMPSHAPIPLPCRARFFGDSDGGESSGAIDNDDSLAAALTAWEMKVIDTVPAEKLLVYKVGDGWKPLCDFLNVPGP